MLPIITQNGHTIHAIFDFLLINHTPLCSNIQQSTFPHQLKLAVRPFSPERETFEPLPLSIQIHSLRLRVFLDTYIFVKIGN